LYAGKNALIYDSVQEEGNIYTVLKNSDKKYVDNFEVIKGELYYFAQNEQEKKWAQDIGIKVSPYIIIDGELMSADKNLNLMDEATGSIIIPQSVTKIGEGAFSNLEGLRTIVIPGTVKEIGTNAFRNNKTLEKIIIQEGVEIIGNEAFRECSNLETIELPESIKTIGTLAFYTCPKLQSVKIPSQITKIEDYTFGQCRSLASVQFSGNNLKEFGKESFYGTKFSEIIITENVEKISETAFAFNSNLNNITINNDKFIYENGILMPKNKNSIIFISNKYYHEKTDFKIPEGVENLETSIANFNTIKKLIITSKLKKINARGLPISIEEIEIEGENEYYRVSEEEKCLYTKNKELIYCYSKEEDINLKLDVETICEYAFNGAQKAIKITLPPTTKNIGNQILSSVSTIKELVIGSNVEEIHQFALLYKYNTKLTINNNNNYVVENNVLYKNSNSNNKAILVTVLNKIKGKFVVDDKVKVIGENAFYGQTEMTEIELKSVEQINYGPFALCNQLTKIDIAQTIKSISSQAFRDAPNLKQIVIHKEKNSISGYPWGSSIGNRLEIKWEE